MRSTPTRLITVSWMTISRSVPPIHLAADRGVFALGVLAHDEEIDVAGRRPASGERTPGIRRTGRRLTYWSNSRRNCSSEPQSETWSGTVSGQPTAPKKIASWPPILCLPVVRHHRAVLDDNSRRRRSRTCRTPGRDRKSLGRLHHHAHALRHDLLADAVAGDHRDLQGFCSHGSSSHAGRGAGGTIEVPSQNCQLQTVDNLQNRSYA